MNAYVVNPATGKKIKVGGPVFNALPKTTRDKLLVKESNRSSSTRTKMASPRSSPKQTREKDIEELKKLAAKCFPKDVLDSIRIGNLDIVRISPKGIASVDPSGRIEMICVYPEDRNVRKRLIETLLSKVDPKNFVHNLELDSNYQESMSIYTEMGFRPRELLLTNLSLAVEKSKKGGEITKQRKSRSMSKTQGLISWPKEGEEPAENWSIIALRRYAEKHDISLKGATKKVNVLKAIRGETDLEPETVRKKSETSPTKFKVGDYVVAHTDSMPSKTWYFGRVAKITPTGQVRINMFNPQRNVLETRESMEESSESYRVTDVDSKTSGGKFIRVSSQGKWKEYPYTFWRTISKKELLEKVFTDSYNKLH